MGMDLSQALSNKDTFGMKASLLGCPASMSNISLWPLQQTRWAGWVADQPDRNLVSRCQAPLRASGSPAPVLVTSPLLMNSDSRDGHSR